MGFVAVQNTNNDFKYGILKEQYFSYIITPQTIVRNVPYNYIYSFYEKTGTLLSPILKQASVGSVVKILTFENNQYLGIEVFDNETRSDGLMYFTGWWRIYNSDGTVKQNVTRGALSTTLGYVINGVTQYAPWYLSLIADFDSKDAYLAIFFISGTPDNCEILTSDAFRLTMNSKTLFSYFVDNMREYDTDPWASSGYAGIGGGEGTFDFESDTVELPSIPSVDSVSSGFLQLFSGGLSKIIELSKYMWSTDFFDSIVKITSNPIDIIMGLYMYPFIVPATSRKYVRAGNVITNILMNVPDSQIFEVDCGVFPVPQFYGAYLDYEPFSKCEIYLPYCGTFNLSMDDISGKEISVKYRVDLLTGLCVAYVIIDGTVKYNFTGSCAINIPISSRSFENLYNSIIGLVGSMFGGGSFSAPSVGSVSGVVTSGKNQITHGGIASGNAGYLGVQKPYLIFNVPRVAIPKGLNKYTGYPIFSTYKLKDLKGYTEVEEIHLENMGTATKQEIDRIVSLLKGGVIL